MFFFCRPKPLTVHLFTAREDVFLHAKPQKAINYFPEWVKQIPKANFPEDQSEPLKKKLTIKSCPAFANLYSKGFMFPLWSDLNVEVSGDSWRYQFFDGASYAESHSSSQIAYSPFEENYIQLKLNNPWAYISDADVDMLFTPPSWNNFGFGDVIVAQGAYSPYRFFSRANINLFFKKQPERAIYQLFFGHPLVHVVPVTERKLILKHELVTESEFSRRHAANGLHLFGQNRFKRLRKLCPHGK